MDFITYIVIGVLIVAAYLLGSIPSAVMVSKHFYGIDIRDYGSKNAGSTNVLRVLGRRAALPVFALDFFKGFVAVAIMGLLGYDDSLSDVSMINLRIVAVFVAVIGHIFPIFAGFKGGKGVATLVGAITGIYPPIMLYCFAVWFVMLIITSYVSLSSMVGGICFPIFTMISPAANESIVFIIFSWVVAVLLIVTHRKNIGRLRRGEESKTYVFGNAERRQHTPK
ncbi:MAG: glycerol-3-phosphate 1-O-acyltransferase PlsY [Rikenellaceae bacterium]